ncbi:hypothetical protein ACOMHN_025416 [Nucella lapillus]
MNVEDQRSGRNVKRRKGVEETERLLADDSTRLLLPRGEGEGEGEEGQRIGTPDNVSATVSVRSVLSFRRAEGSFSMMDGSGHGSGGGSGGGGGGGREDEEDPPAYTSTPITPSHTQQDVGGGGGGGEGVSSRCRHSQADGLTTCLKMMVRWVRSVGGLIVLLLAYTFFGAWIMITIEGPAEVQQKQKVYTVRESIADELKNNTRALQTGQMNDTEWKRRTDDLLLELETVTHSTGVASISKKKWTFFGAVLFCVTTYTTIGYGNIAPTTNAGRIATMLYAIIGIPLALIVLADLGHRLTNGLKFVWSFVRRYYYTGYCRKVSKRVDKTSYDMNESNVGVDVGDGANFQHEGTYTQTNGAAAESQALYRDEVEKASGDNGKRPKRAGEALVKPHLQEVEGTENSSLSATPRKDAVDVLRRSQSVERTSLANSKTSSMHDCRQSRGHSGSPSKREGSIFIDQEELNEDFKLPVGVAVAFIFVYIFAGAGVYKLWEDWTYLESFYFVFITTSTIGFGDVLPEHPNFFLLSCVYTFLGLALVSMTINVIMEWLAKTIDRAKERVDQAREKAMAKAKAATDKLTEVGCKAKNKVLHTVGREGSASPQLKTREERGTEPGDNDDAMADQDEGQESTDHTQATEHKDSSHGKPGQTQEPESEPVATRKGTDPQKSPQSDSTLGSTGQGKGGTTDASTPSSDNEASFRTAADFSASTDSVSEKISDKK